MDMASAIALGVFACVFPFIPFHLHSNACSPSVSLLPLHSAPLLVHPLNVPFSMPLHLAPVPVAAVALGAFASVLSFSQKDTGAL
jgi:hypothetical protein